MKFRLLRGKHIQNNPKTKQEEVFHRDSVLESDTDLTRFGREKFERVSDDTPVKKAKPKDAK